MTATDRSAYIAYIDGIRALAVLAVMLYHLKPSLLPGGFVGVDIFFVISGFVVTASLASHGQENLGTFLGNFYARRLVRLIPALVTMLVTTTLAYVLLVPKAWFNRAAESVGQAAFWGLSNWVLDRQTINYFEPRAELNPFTHTWSLGVEEQFYLIAPLLLFVALRRPAAHRHRQVVVLTIGGLAAFSLLSCYYFGVTKGARFVFYHLAFRFWELAFGALLFLGLPGIRRLSAHFSTRGCLSGVAGLLLVVVAMLMPHSSTYPFVRASVAVLGALLLISSAHASPQDAVRRALASRTAVWIGRRSYALYLWHWPVYVLARWTVGLTVWPFNAGALAVTFLLAAVSYRAVEQPFRTSVWLKAWPPSLRIGLCLLMMAAGWFAGRGLLEQQPRLGLGKVTQEASDWYGDRQFIRTSLAANRRCDPVATAVDIGSLTGAGNQFDPKDCPSKAASRLFVIGDSHATAYLPMLEQLSAEDGRTITVLPTPGCSYMDLQGALDEAADPHCYQVARDALRTVLDQARPGDTVFLPSLRLPRLIHLGGERRQVPPNLAGQEGDLFDLTELELAALTRAKSDAHRWIEPLVSARLQVVLEAPKPIFRAHPFACVEWWNRWNPECSAGLDERRLDLERYRAPMMDALRDLATTYPGVTIWDPLQVLCGKDVCSAMQAGRPLFFDGDHLSPYGNFVLLRSFQRAVQRAEAPRGQTQRRLMTPR